MIHSQITVIWFLYSTLGYFGLDQKKKSPGSLFKTEPKEKKRKKCFYVV